MFTPDNGVSNIGYKLNKTFSEIKPYFSIGLHGVGMQQNEIRIDDAREIGIDTLGGAGFYLYVRPSRYVSLELYNDYIFGSYAGKSGTMMKAPFALGLRGHFLDRGRLDVYIAAAATSTWVSLLSGGYLDSDDLSTQLSVTSDYVLFGGQFGGGISYIFGGENGVGLLVGLDVRYYIEQGHESTPFGDVKRRELSQGLTFSMNIGMAI